jgi:Ca2+-binding EF-hand superfamily protein
MTQADELFAELDKNHDGRIDREEILASCRKN